MLAVAVIGDLIVIILVSSLGGALACRLGQPSVSDQILAGIALGPSLLGRLPGNMIGHVFPATVAISVSVTALLALIQKSRAFADTRGAGRRTAARRGRRAALTPPYRETRRCHVQAPQQPVRRC